MILKLFFFLCSTFLSVSAFHDVEDVVVVEEPSHITCREYGEPMPNAEDCSKYHVCGHCEANSGYHPSQTCLYTISCPPDQLFHPSLKMCYRTSVCPTVSFPRHEVPCQFPGETFSHPDGCQKYLECSKLPRSRQWHVLEKFCPVGECYDVVDQQCSMDRLRGRYCLPEVLDHKCLYTGDYFPHPGSCKKYYACDKVAQCGRKYDYWGYLTIECAEGKFFHAKSKRCVAATECPQNSANSAANETKATTTPAPGTGSTTLSSNTGETTTVTTTVAPTTDVTTTVGSATVNGSGNSTTSFLLPPADFDCKQIGDKHVLPYDCKYYSKCRKNKKNEFYVTHHRCPIKQKFYQKQKKCITTWTCPQDPDWQGIPKCENNHDHRIKDSEDCTRYWWFMEGCKGPIHGQCDEGSYFSGKTESCKTGECPYPMPKGRTISRRTIFYPIIAI